MNSLAECFPKMLWGHVSVLLQFSISARSHLPFPLSANCCSKETTEPSHGFSMQFCVSEKWCFGLSTWLTRLGSSITYRYAAEMKAAGTRYDALLYMLRRTMLNLRPSSLQIWRWWCKYRTCSFKEIMERNRVWNQDIKSFAQQEKVHMELFCVHNFVIWIFWFCATQHLNASRADVETDQCIRSVVSRSDL